ncbi:MAG: hypothetical protein HKN72_17105 [Gemmatimonadetes bacterium]|nr:hypothetical protein [Gemmatimonadota bacterium]
MIRLLSRLCLLVLLVVVGCTGHSDADPRLDLPLRPIDAPTGSELARELRGLELEEREQRVHREIVGGNVPDWLRRLRPVTVSGEVSGRRRTVTFWAAPDYLAVGSDENFLRIPLSPQTAWDIAEAAGAALPTPAMSDAIWQAADVRLGPTPIPPNRLMTTVPVFEDHQRKVQRQRDRAAAAPGALVAGHKKDVVLTPRLADQPGRVAIYGWHYLSGDPIQPLYLGHTDDWVDYSHGIRLVDDTVAVDGEMRSLAAALADPALAPLLSREGPIANVPIAR